MPNLVWDKVGSRIYETGLDKGVLYLPNGTAVPWNGLTSVIEKFDRATSQVYYDGMKINDLVILGDFQATMKAVTYPDEFVEVEGALAIREGFFVVDQPPQLFGLCYRTQIGNDLDGDSVAYKLHILYNVTAIPSDKTYASRSVTPSLVEFEWNIVAVPNDCLGFRPTAHIIIDSREYDPMLLQELENMLYGTNSTLAALIPMCELIDIITNWCRIKIIDNEDGTWTAISIVDDLILFNILDPDIFTILEANLVDLGDNTFLISNTCDVSDLPDIKIIDNGDGTWVAVTEHDNLFSVDETGLFEILNANAVIIGPETYQVSDTIE